MLLGLICVFYPCLKFPPVSDTWEMLYSFNNLNSFPGSAKWLHILNFDPVEEVGYRPLAHLIYYLIYMFSNPANIFFNIFNFILYFTSIVLLYRFSLYFIKNKFLAASFITYFAFLFSHCDIILWSAHIFILLGVCLFLVGYIFFIEYLKTNRTSFLVITIPFFLLGTMCYESFVLWPFTIIFLAFISDFNTVKSPSITKKAVSMSLALAAIYSLGIMLFLFIRSLGTYENPFRSASDFFNLKIILSSGAMALFNLLYNTILVNIIPIIPFPLKVTENIYMAGPVINYVHKYPQIVTFIDSFAAIGLLVIFILFFRKKQFKEFIVIGLFLYLIISESFIVYLGKLGISHTFAYCLSEFRYQYIPNAFFVLLIAYLFDRHVIPSRKSNTIVISVLILLCSINIYSSKKVLNIYTKDLLHLNKIITSVRSGINNGTINSENKVHIQNDIPDYLPSLCWNIEMGERFIKDGNYKWLFHGPELNYFADSIGDAKWIVDKESFDIVERTPNNINKKGVLIGKGKSDQFNFLALHYAFIDNDNKAMSVLKKAIEMNPDDMTAHQLLESLYKKMGLNEEALQINKRVLELNNL